MCDRLYLNNLKNQQQRISLRLMYQQTEGHLKKHVQNLQRLLRIIWIPSDQQEVFLNELQTSLVNHLYGEVCVSL